MFFVRPQHSLYFLDLAIIKEVIVCQIKYCDTDCICQFRNMKMCNILFTLTNHALEKDDLYFDLSLMLRFLDNCFAARQ